MTDDPHSVDLPRVKGMHPFEALLNACITPRQRELTESMIAKFLRYGTGSMCLTNEELSFRLGEEK